jgi:hypothetical protein
MPVIRPCFILQFVLILPFSFLSLIRAQPWRIAHLKLVLYHASDSASTLRLINEPWAVSTGDLLGVWVDLQYLLQAQSEARQVSDLNSLERLHIRQAHPPPASIDFRGAT